MLGQRVAFLGGDEALEIFYIRFTRKEHILLGRNFVLEDSQ